MFGLATEWTDSFLVTSWCDGGGTERVDVTDDIEPVDGGCGSEEDVVRLRVGEVVPRLCGPGKL